MKAPVSSESVECGHGKKKCKLLMSAEVEKEPEYRRDDKWRCAGVETKTLLSGDESERRPTINRTVYSGSLPH